MERKVYQCDGCLRIINHDGLMNQHKEISWQVIISNSWDKHTAATLKFDLCEQCLKTMPLGKLAQSERPALPAGA